MRYAFAAATFGLSATLALSLPAQGRAADAVHPTVIELFQSQGCSSCPPANANVLALSGRADLLSLSFGVTYWDYLGWRDTFAQPQFTQRQRDYARALGHDNVFTPQVVINGRVDGVGDDPRELNGLIRTGDRGLGGPSLAIRGGAVEVGAGAAPTAGADVWLVRFDPRIVQVAIQAGENGGRTLPHRNVVRTLVRLGRWSGAAARLPLPPSLDPALATAVLVQTSGAGPILAAARG
jgi:hypothetical protein